MAAGVFFAADPVRGHYGNQVRLYMQCVSRVDVQEGGGGADDYKQSQKTNNPYRIPTSASAT